MKNLSLFLIALILLVSAVPSNAQRRREAQKQQPQTEQPTPSGGGRRARQGDAKPSVPCIIPLANSPYLRRLKLNLTAAQVVGNFETDIFFDWSRGASAANGFISSFDFVPLQTPRKTLAESLSPEQIAEAKRVYEMMHPGGLEKIRKQVEEERRNAPPKPPEANPNEVIQKMSAQFYGRGNNSILYNFQIIYRNDLVFENVRAIEESFAENLKIPVGSWMSIPDPDYGQKVLASAFSLLNFRLIPVENLILRQANCEGWRAVYITSPTTTGLALSISNSSVSDNIERLIAEDQKAIDDAQKQRTKKIFKP